MKKFFALFACASSLLLFSISCTDLKEERWRYSSSSDEEPSSSSLEPADCEVRPHFIDYRDEGEYSFVKIGEQWWMKENLTYTLDIKKGDDYDCPFSAGNYCLENGYAYKWIVAADTDPAYEGTTDEDAVGRKGICPFGSHLPSKGDWQTLIDFVGEGSAHKLIGEKYYGGTDDFCFSANNDIGGDFSTWWSASNSGDKAYVFKLSSGTIEITEEAKNDIHPIRCILN
ncbi:MAG: hypothetical protein LBH25_06830 [Fibromonadaceae bacterium]|jgi:uncharacterized protein (TIGR02145 family)|nr:hypothetical protein [Fibromonadaceae bacterium]